MDPREPLTEYRILPCAIAAPVLDSSAVPNPDPLEGLRLQDAGMRVKALSRWNNYYVAGMLDPASCLIVCVAGAILIQAFCRAKADNEGLRCRRHIPRRMIAHDCLCRLQRVTSLTKSYVWRLHVDGTQEIAYDRITMLRARKVLGDRGRIDHHADHGFVSQSPVINYMELYLFPANLYCLSALSVSVLHMYPLEQVSVHQPPMVRRRVWYVRCVSNYSVIFSLKILNLYIGIPSLEPFRGGPDFSLLVNWTRIVDTRPSAARIDRFVSPDQLCACTTDTQITTLHPRTTG